MSECEEGQLRVITLLNPSGSVNVMNESPYSRPDLDGVIGKLFQGDFVISLDDKGDIFAPHLYDFVKVVTRVGIGMIPSFVLKKNTKIVTQPVHECVTEYLPVVHTTLEQQKQQREQQPPRSLQRAV